MIGRSERLSLVVMLALSLTGCKVAESLSPTTTNVPLSAARQLEGTWKTPAPVSFYYQTNFCSNTKQTVASALWNVTWTITAVAGFSNVLDVTMTFSRGSSTSLQSTCGNGGNGWVPLVSPTFFRMTVSSSSIVANDTRQGISVGGSYTTALMNATWVHYECGIYCFGEFTQAEQLKMMKQ